MKEMICEKKSLSGKVYVEMELCWDRTFLMEMLIAIIIYKNISVISSMMSSSICGGFRMELQHITWKQ